MNAKRETLNPKPIGILVGTFDPIHYGHLRPAQEVMRALDLAEVRIIPAANPPHRRAPLATAAQRLRMAELAVAEFPGLRVDDREIKRGGPSYTVLTLESLRGEFGARPLCLLLGLDAFEGLETWYQLQRLPELTHFVVMTRPGWSLPAADVLPAWARGRLAHAAGDLARAQANFERGSASPDGLSGLGAVAAARERGGNVGTIRRSRECVRIRGRASRGQTAG